MTDYRTAWLRKYARITDDKAFDTLVAIADLVVEYTDGDNDWKDDISDQVGDALKALGVLTECEHGCSGGLMVNGGDCHREHPCPACGYPSDDCQCCGECECYPCECPDDEPEVEEEDA